MFSIFSEKAVSVLKEYLLPHGELLPLFYQDKSYYLFHTLMHHDNIVDEEKSRFHEEHTALSWYHFNADKVTKPIFTLKYDMDNFWLYVTQEFKQVVEENNLTGFSFRQVWPSEDWDIEETS